MSCRLFGVTMLVAGLLALLGGPALRAAGGGAGEFVWLEGEQPTACNVTPERVGTGHPEFLSGGKWLYLNFEGGKIGKEVPAEGVLLSYDFAAPKTGSYEMWNRIGMEAVRSPFEWRIDEGAWATIVPSDLTTDLMELSTWCEVAWIKLGRQSLGQGPHRLQIRIAPAVPEKGKPPRILYASDALCLTAGGFSPNSKFKPDETGQDERYGAAARQVFELPAPAAPGARSAVALQGLWEICRDDEQLPGEVAAPIGALPADPHWTAIAVPGDKGQLRPDLEMAHRVWYRTRINVPAACAGRSFYLVFPQNNLNTTVYVNGQLCGFDKNPFARIQIDVSKVIKPGVNELCVGIRDAWYGYSTNPGNPLKLRKVFNLPREWLGKGFQDYAYPIWGHSESGILATPELVAAGGVYAADVFCKPSVARRQLALEVTVMCPEGRPAGEVAGEVVCEAVNAQTGQVEKQLAPQPFVLTGGQSQVLQMAAPWDNAKLWWPDEPNLYQLWATVKVGGQAVDVSRTTFGFREWSWEGREFKLNGLVWHGWADTFTAPTPEAWLKFYRQSNQRMMRFWGTRWHGLAPEQALDFFDHNGVVVRRSGLLDGEMIGYNAIENDPELKKLYNSPLKMQLLANWKDQMVAQVRGERNHPSVMLWSIENEWLYINCINLYGNLMDQFEAAVWETARAVMVVDPTRAVMNDGGGAHKNNAMPVHGDHYVVGDFSRYPALAYEANPTGGGRGRWTWDQQRPRFLGEDYYAAGIDPADYAYFSGEEAFQGKAQARRGAGLLYRILTEGYRWAGYGAWHFWLTQDAAVSQYGANSPVAVFCKQWDWTFAAGQKVMRTLRLFNDSRDGAPITLAWTFTVAGQKVAGDAKAYVVPAGTASDEFPLTLTMPAVTGRAEGELTLVLTQEGREVFRDVKAISILNTDLKSNKPAALAALRAADLLVYDPAGTAAAFLKANAIPFTPLADLATLPAAGKILLIGQDALTPADAASTKFQAWAAAGRVVLVLEQKTPLRFQALPADAEVSAAEGRTAFIENPDHPLFAGLADKDFFTWGDAQLVYRNAYLKPTRGGHSLLQCHHRLTHTALLEMPTGPGLLLVSQLLLGEKLAVNAPAQRLLTNLLAYAAAYKLEPHPVAVCTRDLTPALAKTLDDIKLHYASAPDPLAALALPGIKTALIPASPANLHALVTHLAQVQAFTAGGGYLLFHGLTPEGLADYNRLVGVDHLLRPFARERVTFPAVRSPLTAGLTTGDIVLRSGQKIFPWAAGEYVASDMFSYIVDYDEIAPFATSSFGNYANIVNGFVGSDGWPLVIDFPVPKDGSPFSIDLRLPRPETLVAYTHIASTNYMPTTRIRLLFDGKDPLEFPTEPTNAPQTFTLDPPRTARTVTLQITAWQAAPDKAANVGIDNIYLKVQRSPAFYAAVKPMLNIGGLMHYPQGPGGMVLCNLLFKESEAVPENAAKKAAILAAILRNLKAPFAEGKTLLPEADLTYQSIDLSKQATQFRDEKGWFGDKATTFKDLPTGRQKFAGVPYDIYDFATSPVPTVLMLGGQGIPNNCPERITGIPVNRKADALFFLQAARLDARRSAKESAARKQYELCHYLIHYADGQTVTLPVFAETDLDEYRQQEPKPLPGAQLAWVRPYETGGLSAVAYSLQWTNPRPDVAITTIDLAYPAQKRGVPCLLALTAATAK